MRLSTKLLSVGLALATFVPAAEAADWNRGSVKDRGGIAVPAPIPVVETFKWYLRADVGLGLTTGGDPSEQGLVYGLDRDPADGPAFGMNSAWFNNGFDTFAMGGIGVGAYLSPRLRTDLTIDVRTKSDIDAHGTYGYNQIPAAPGPATVRVTGTSIDKTEARTTLALANLYWDLTERGTRFTPYIGVGLGFAVRSTQRTHETTETLWDITDPLNVVNMGNRGFLGKGKAHQLAPAASATAGFAYTLDTGMVLDLNYRFTYLGAADAATLLTGNQSRLEIGDTFDHALRAGIRWNVW
jgi:opacity protein-like surface antigen